MTRMRWMKSSTILVNIYWWCEPHTQNPVMVSTTLGNKWPPNLQGEESVLRAVHLLLDHNVNAYASYSTQGNYMGYHPTLPGKNHGTKVQVQPVQPTGAGGQNDLVGVPTQEV